MHHFSGESHITITIFHYSVWKNRKKIRKKEKKRQAKKQLCFKSTHNTQIIIHNELSPAMLSFRHMNVNLETNH